MRVTQAFVTGTASVVSDFIPSLLASCRRYALSGLKKALAWIKIKLRNFTYHLSSMLFTRVASSENLLVYIYVWLMWFESTQISLLQNTADQFTCQQCASYHLSENLIFQSRLSVPDAFTNCRLVREYIRITEILQWVVKTNQNKSTTTTKKVGFLKEDIQFVIKWCLTQFKSNIYTNAVSYINIYKVWDFIIPIFFCTQHSKEWWHTLVTPGFWKQRQTHLCDLKFSLL